METGSRPGCSEACGGRTSGLRAGAGPAGPQQDPNAGPSQRFPTGGVHENLGGRGWGRTAERASAQAAGPPEGGQEVWAEARAAAFSKAPGILLAALVGWLCCGASAQLPFVDSLLCRWGRTPSPLCGQETGGPGSRLPQHNPLQPVAGSGSLLAHHWKGSRQNKNIKHTWHTDLPSRSEPCQASSKVAEVGHRRRKVQQSAATRSRVPLARGSYPAGLSPPRTPSGEC